MSEETRKHGRAEADVKNLGTSAETEGDPGSVAGEGFVLRDAGPVRSGKDRSPPLPPVDFSSFVLGLGQMTLIHLGEMPEPFSGKVEKDLAQASHTIDLLDLLAEKTRGNLSADEAQLLGNLRRELKLKYVQAR
ncbi:MAG: DUF1844 domain-containing protein [Deferrisomatales bacterium]|nr:DUF1844 domain-containing protein [Deferrisomatales bacterium]